MEGSSEAKDRFTRKEAMGTREVALLPSKGLAQGKAEGERDGTGASEQRRRWPRRQPGGHGWQLFKLVR